MLLAARFNPSRLFPREDETLFAYWLSFSPMAPLFGVEWRFGGVQIEVPKGTSSARTRKAKDAVDAEIIPIRKPTPKAEAEQAEEPVAAAAVEPVAQEPVAPAAAEPATPDDLTKIKGVGPTMALKLNAAGITTYAQIAAWTEADVARMGAELGGLPGAITRGDWVGQAKALAG